MGIHPVSAAALAMWLGVAAPGLAATGSAQQATPSEAHAAQVIASCAHGAPVTGSDAQGRFRACFQAGELAYVEERANGAPKGKVMRYVYEQGALVYFRTDAAPQGPGGASAAGAATVPVTIEWTASGEVRRAVRLEHFGEVRLGADVVGATYARGVTLAGLARAARPAP